MADGIFTKDTIRFAEGNTIIYGLDFGLRVGVPSGVDFRLEGFGRDNIVLQGPGYGDPDDYGNGCIVVFFQKAQPKPEK